MYVCVIKYIHFCVCQRHICTRAAIDIYKFVVSIVMCSLVYVNAPVHKYYLCTLVSVSTCVTINILICVLCPSGQSPGPAAAQAWVPCVVA